MQEKEFAGLKLHLWLNQTFFPHDDTEKLLFESTIAPLLVETKNRFSSLVHSSRDNLSNLPRVKTATVFSPSN